VSEGGGGASGGPSGVRELLRRHPVIVATIVACTLLGAGLGPWLLAEEWSLARRLAAGAVAGAGTGFLLVATKLY
jgi:hypothetical protein